MNQEKTAIKVIVCVPYVRTFVVIVRKSQKISIIKEAFPNINCQSKLNYWFNGSLISPHLKFDEIDIQEFQSIIVTVQTDDISINSYFMKISKFENIQKAVMMIKNVKSEKKTSDDRIINRCFNYEREKKKFFFIQKLKQLFDQFDFSKNKTISIVDDHQISSINVSPIPILA